jgi:hypothetical protein
MVSTGDLYSVVFPLLHPEGIRIFTETAPSPITPTWLGIPCRPIYIRIGLKIQEEPHPRPFRMFALLPLDPEAIPTDVVPVLRIGTQFLLQHKVEVSLPFGSAEGKLLIPY